MISFQNDGLIDLRAITTFGINAKEVENPIGFFGTGLKYAIAITLRNGGSISIYLGEDRYSFSAQEEEVRGQPFNFVYMSGPAGRERLGFTTDLGKKWEAWQAFRELYSNMLDEPGGRASAGRLEPCLGKTTIIVDGFALLDAAYADRSQYFLEAQPTFIEADADFLQQNPGNVYYRGVRVGKFPQAAVFGYNVKKDIELTEDRTIKYNYQVEAAIARAIRASRSEYLLERFIGAPKDTFEHKADLTWGHNQPSQEFMEVVERIASNKNLTINQSALAIVKELKPEVDDYELHKLNPVEEQQLSRALAFLSSKFDFNPDKYPILFVEATQRNGLGRADRKQGRILISKECFAQGTKMLAGTLLEEYIHLQEGVDDCTREMQNHLINMLMTLGERLQGKPL